MRRNPRTQRGRTSDGASESIGDRLARRLDQLSAPDGTGPHRDEVVFEAIDEVASETARENVASLPEHARFLTKHRFGFEESLRGVWGPALDAFDVALEANHHYGAEFNERYRSVAATDSLYKFEVLASLHARACR